MGNKKRPTDVFDLAIWLAFIIFLFAGVAAYSDNWYNFTISKFTVFPLDDEGRAFSVAFNFTAPVFAVNQDIQMSIVARPSASYIQNFPEEVSKINELYLYFTGISTKQDIYIDGIRRSPTLLMTKEPDGWFRGEYTMRYDEEGNKCFSLDIKRLVGLPTYCKVADEQPMLIISSHDTTLQYQTNKIFMGLTLVVVGLSIISARDQLRSILRISRKQPDEINDRKDHFDKSEKKKKIR